jgi:aminopeptidase N
MGMMTLRLGLFLSVFLVSLPASPATVSRPYLVEHYDATLRLDAASGRLKGTVRLRVRALEDSLSTVHLDSDELDVTEVRAGRQPLAFAQQTDLALGSRLVVTLPRPLERGARRVLTINYEGVPKVGLHISPDQAWTAFSTSHWLPSNGRPDNRATYRLRLDVPEGWSVVASGRCVQEHVREHRRISTWMQTVPIPSFVFGFAAGNFHSAEVPAGKLRLRMLSGRHTADQLLRLGRLTQPMLEFFAERAGVPYAGERYTQVFAHGNPMQEVGGFTLLPEQYGDDLLAHPDEQWLMAHEFAHQWWGIGITCRTWSDFWLNEGMATFLADVYLGELFGPARYQNEIERSRQLWEEWKQGGRDRPLHFTAWTTPQQSGGRIPYHKGAWVLHLLRQDVGPAAFWRGLQLYTKAHWEDSATSEDLQQAMERASGRNLKEFFRAWVYDGAGILTP